MFRLLLILAMISLSIGCDQVSKTITRDNIRQQETIELIGHHFTLTNIENSGAFLSLGGTLSAAAKNILLSILPAIALIMLFIFLVTKSNMKPVLTIALCFVIGGGVGNIYDRIMHGSVTDFLHIHFGIFQTGIFNLADVSIMMGVGVVLIYSLKKKMFH